jgi:hypothetical protein
MAPLNRSPMRDAIAMSMMAGTQPQDQQSRPVFGSPPVSLAPPMSRPPVFGGGAPQQVGSSRPAVFTGNNPVTPTPQPIAPTMSAGQAATQGVNAGYRYGRMAQPTPADPFSQQNDPFNQYGMGNLY